MDEHDLEEQTILSAEPFILLVHSSVRIPSTFTERDLPQAGPWAVNARCLRIHPEEMPQLGQGAVGGPTSID